MAHNSDLIIMKLDENAVLRVEHRHGARVEALPVQHSAAQTEFKRLLRAFPGACICWYDTALEAYLTETSEWPALLKHPLEVLHTGCFQRTDIVFQDLGFIEHDSPFFLKGPTDRRYATTLISPMCGIGRTDAFQAMGFSDAYATFAEAIVAFGIKSAPQGLFPYSDPRLIAQPLPASVQESVQRPLPANNIARLIARAYGRKWLAVWFLSNLAFRRKAPILSLARAGKLSCQPLEVRNNALSQLAPELNKNAAIERANYGVDVVIPTLQRPQFIADVLDDLATQTIIPRSVILIEQGIADNSSLLAGIKQKHWPFNLSVHSVPWIGACKARNLGIAACRSDWLLFLDDDVRFSPNMICHLLNVAQQYSVESVTSALYLPNQDPKQLSKTTHPYVWPYFGTGACLVLTESVLAAGGFDERLEHGYGEDYEFGVRLRQSGANVVYAPGEPVLHLKAPSGGFRHKFNHPWSKDRVTPRPSPTVLYSRNKHVTRPMQQGYALYYWLKRLGTAPLYAWPAELIKVARQWRSAKKWSDRMANQTPNTQ